MDTYRHISTLRLDSNPVPVLPTSAFRTFARFSIGSPRATLIGEDGVSRHFEVIRDGNEIRYAQVEGDRIDAIGVDEFKAHVARAIGQLGCCDLDCVRPARGDGEVRQAESPGSNGSDQ